LIGHQGFAPPVLGEEGEEPALDLVPFRRC
jgi:hypothetical protein